MSIWNKLESILTQNIFFSIASSIAEFGDIKSLGRVAVKIMTGYMITSFIAIMIGLGVYKFFPKGKGIQAAWRTCY